jgi:hypothetical protein
MPRMPDIEPSIPFHVARAHGAQHAARPGRVSVTPLRRTDEAHAAQIVRAGAERLVAAVVPGGVDFSAGVPAASPAALPMYRHPADRNAAAVSIHAGRMIDVNA